MTMPLRKKPPPLPPLPNEVYCPAHPSVKTVIKRHCSTDHCTWYGPCSVCETTYQADRERTWVYRKWGGFKSFKRWNR
jgi:hypothetical protein